MPSPETPVEAEQNPERLDLKRKLKLALTIAAVGVGGSLLRDVETPLERKVEEAFSLAPLKDRFDVQWESAGRRYIVHLGQIHAQNDLASAEAAPKSKQIIIEAQKNVEQAILYLREAYGVQEIYVEGITADIEDRFRTEDEAAQKLEADLAAKQFNQCAKTINQWVINYASRIKTGEYRADKGRAIDAYFLLCRIRDLFKAYEAEEECEDIDPEISTTLNVAKFALERDRLLANDNVYLWDAVEKLRSERKIRILAAENKELAERAEKVIREIHRKDERGVLTEEDIEAFVGVHNEREDEALRFAFQGAEKDSKRLRVIIYGNAHDFYGNLKNLQELGKGKDFGVLRLNNRQQLEWDKMTEEDLPEYNQPSLEDKR